MLTEYTYEDFVRELDFDVIECLGENCSIYKASRNKELVTVKFGKFPGSWDYHHVITENKTLDRVGKVEGIVEKVSFHDFKDDKLVAIVKKYVEGEELCDYPGQFDSDVLVNAVKALHEKGIVTTDLYAWNIIVDPSGKPCIIDLGCSFFEEDEVSKEIFADVKQKDLIDLERMIKIFHDRL